MTESTGPSAFSDQTDEPTPTAGSVPRSEPTRQSAPAAAPAPAADHPAAASSPQRTTKQTYPVRGVLWGILFGLGLAIVAIVTTVIPLSVVPAIVVLLIGTGAGTLWSLFGPAKAASK